MPVPNIILPRPWILITDVSSVLSILPLQDSFKFGLVELVYDTSDKTRVGDYVMYDPKQGKPFIYGSTIYILIQDNYTAGTEIPPP